MVTNLSVLLIFYFSCTLVMCWKCSNRFYSIVRLEIQSKGSNYAICKSAKDNAERQLLKPSE